MYYIEDTNVISKAESNLEFRSRLDEKRRELEESGFSHAITPPLLVELITGLAGSPDGVPIVDWLVNFHRGQMKMRLLYPFDRPLPTILPSPNVFALKTALNVISPKAANLNETDFGRWIDIVFCAQSPEELWSTGVQISPVDPRRHTIDRDSVRKRYELEIQLHEQFMSQARQHLSVMTQDDFARSILKIEGILLPRDEEVSILANAIDAAYMYHSWLFDQARNGYKFEAPKHKGDAMDYAYLLYLADPGIRFLTMDSDIKTRVGTSPQAKQIEILQ